MARRPLRDLDDLTLFVLTAVAVAPTDSSDPVTPQSNVCRFVALVREDRLASGHLERKFECAFPSSQNDDRAVSELALRLRHAALACDVRTVTSVLWHAARRPGLAWRRLELRARNALVALALMKASALHLEQDIAAK